MKEKLSITVFISVLSYVLSIDCFDANCKRCSDENYGSCQECTEKFRLIGGVCACHDQNCLKCESSNIGACSECKPGFQKANGICYCKYNHCYECGEGRCSLCEQGYKLNPDTGECDLDTTKPSPKCFDDNCLSCVNAKEGACVVCGNGHQVNNGVCEKMDGCLVYEDGTNNDCKECKTNFILSKYCDEFDSNDNDNCLKFHKACDKRCYGANCEFLGNCDGGCYFCNSFSNTLYERVDCQSTNKCVNNCYNCLTGASDCIRCHIGYYFDHGECKKCPDENCLRCDYFEDPSKCSACKNNYYFDSERGICLRNDTSLEKYPSNKRTSDSTTGGNGSSGTIPEGIKCNVENCLLCSSTNVCKTCNELKGYSLKNGKCQIKCDVKNCNKCSRENVCQECVANYQLSNNECKIQCQDEHCEQCIAENWCIKCEGKFRLSGAGCLPECTDENCSYCVDSQICVTCKSRYVINEGSCLPCHDTNCTTCSSPDPSSCQSCAYGFLLSDGVCAEKCTEIKKCNYCIENQTKCVSCDESCKLKNGKCSCTNLFTIILPIIICIILISLAFFCYLGYLRKKERQENFYREQQEMELEDQGSVRDNSLQVIPFGRPGQPGQPGQPSHPRKKIDPEKQREMLEEEFLANKVKNKEMDFGLCNYCESKHAKYISDCGCKLCKEHSKPIKELMEEGNDKKCPVCGKIVKKVQQIKGVCGICLENKIKLAKFKCRCALSVCLNCYIKCRTTGDRCPACRAELV